MTSIYQRNGRWQVRWREPGSGRARGKTFAQKPDAQQFQREKEAEIRRLRFEANAAAREEKDRAALQATAAHDTAIWISLLDDAGGIDPTGCYVYLLWSRQGDAIPLYVGASTNVFSRVGTHLGPTARRFQVGWVTLVRCAGPAEMLAREAALIRKFRPLWNAVVPSVAVEAEQVPITPIQAGPPHALTTQRRPRTHPHLRRTGP